MSQLSFTRILAFPDMFQIFRHVPDIQTCSRYSDMFQIFRHVPDIQTYFRQDFKVTYLKIYIF